MKTVVEKIKSFMRDLISKLKTKQNTQKDKDLSIALKNVVISELLSTLIIITIFTMYILLR